MVLNTRLFMVLSVVVAAITIMAGSVLAKNNGDNTRPGWGLGDANHVHTGPPGQSVNQSNNVNVDNNISVSANSGGNSGENITTGDSVASVSVTNNVAQNVHN